MDESWDYDEIIDFWEDRAMMIARRDFYKHEEKQCD